MAASARFITILGLSTALAGACDRTPTAPEMADVAELLAASNPSARVNSRTSRNTLPALFRESIATVEARQGRPAVEMMLSDWRALQEKLKTEAATAPRAVVQNRLAAIHEQELAIVERVLGSRAVTRVITESTAALNDADTQITAASSSGQDMASARSVATDAAEKLEAARRALAASDSRVALESASQAATLIAGLGYYLVETQRVHGIEALFPQAVARINATSGARDDAVIALEGLDAQTRAAVAAGDRARAHRLLAQTRAAQIRLVLRVFGTSAVTRVVAQVDERARSVEAQVRAAPDSGRDSLKIQRMLHEAKDMNARARRALDAGDAATALDLGSHAAGLLNAVQHLTWH
jgi:hypothetical protein